MSVGAFLADAKKFLVALAGILAQMIAAGFLHGTALHYTQTGAAVVAALLVYIVPGPNSPDGSGVSMGEAAGGTPVDGPPSPNAPVA